MSINEKNIINIDDNQLKANTPMVQVIVGGNTFTIPIRPETSFTVNSEDGSIIDITESSVLPYTPMLQVGVGNSARYYPVLNSVSDVPDPINNPLTLTAEEDNVSIALSIYKGSPIVDKLNYRLNNEISWNKYEIGTTIHLNKNEYVQFYNSNDYLSTLNNYVTFTITGKCAARGSILSMANWDSDVTTHCYAYLFYNCTSLTTAPELPATELTESCYYSMFEGCTSLTTAPELPATTLAIYCYDGMFSGCTSLTTAPELPATTLASYCYQRMFDGCANLNYIKVNMTEWQSSPTSSWVAGVSSTGTFYKPSALPKEFGVSRIPSGWTVVNID